MNQVKMINVLFESCFGFEGLRESDIQPMKFTIFYVGKANNCQRESVYVVVMSAISNVTLANIFLSQIDFIRVLTGDVVLVSTFVNPKHKVNLTSHFLWAVSK